MNEKGEKMNLSLMPPEIKQSKPLTEQESRVLSFAAVGMENKLIGKVLGIGEGTVKVHLREVYVKLGLTGCAGWNLRLLSAQWWKAKQGPEPRLQVKLHIEEELPCGQEELP